MDLSSLIISVVSFIVSTISIIISFKQNQNINSLNIQSRYFEKIFDKYLIEEIPKARVYIRYYNNRLADVDKLIDVLGKLKSDSLYFKYSKKNFYEELKENIDYLELFLTNCSNNSESDSDKQYQNMLEIGNKITSIYTIINEYSTGSKK